MKFTNHNRQIYTKLYNMRYCFCWIDCITVNGKYIKILPSRCKIWIGNPCPSHTKNHMIWIDFSACF